MSKIDFQPMPKRFMVYDIPNERFFTIGDAYPKCQISEDERKKFIFSMQDLIALFGEVHYYDSVNDYIVCQSTNLFDKDGEEIFEGSILRGRDDSLSVVQYDGDDGVFRTKSGAVLDDMSCGGDYFEVIGHILSNPELLEEKG